MPEMVEMTGMAAEQEKLSTNDNSKAVIFDRR